MMHVQWIKRPFDDKICHWSSSNPAQWMRVISFYWSDQIQSSMSPRNPCNLLIQDRQFLDKTKISPYSEGGVLGVYEICPYNTKNRL